jgi:hypothetical protein
MLDDDENGTHAPAIPRVSVSLKQNLYPRAVERAEHQQRSLVSLIRWCLVRYLDEAEPEP